MGSSPFAYLHPAHQNAQYSGAFPSLIQTKDSLHAAVVHRSFPPPHRQPLAPSPGAGGPISSKRPGKLVFPVPRHYRRESKPQIEWTRALLLER